MLSTCALNVASACRHDKLKTVNTVLAVSRPAAQTHTLLIKQVPLFCPRYTRIHHLCTQVIPCHLPLRTAGVEPLPLMRLVATGKPAGYAVCRVRR